MLIANSTETGTNQKSPNSQSNALCVCDFLCCCGGGGSGLRLRNNN